LENYFLKQGWTQKLLENLIVTCDLNISANSISAVFNVTEPTVRAVNTGFNQPVWQDSCVELFLSLDNKKYYNFEINCIGSILAQYGENRRSRKFIDPQSLELIRVSSTMGDEPFGVKKSVTSYQIKVLIPKEALIFDENPDLKTISGNIYKCADLSPTPHYMYLFKINTEKPDFHRPEFFRGLKN
jgi:hypothetical protein